MKKSTKAIRPRASKVWRFCRSTSTATQSNIYHVPNIIDWICITTLTQSSSLLYSCIPIASDPSPLPTNAIQFDVVPNACADAIHQQPADKQLECGLPCISQISGANIAASWHHCKHLPTPGSCSAAEMPRVARKTPPGRPKTCELSWSEWAAQVQHFARKPASPAAHHPFPLIGSKTCIDAWQHNANGQYPCNC